MEAPTNFRQDDYTITKITINKRTEEHSEEKKKKNGSLSLKLWYVSPYFL